MTPELAAATPSIVRYRQTLSQREADRIVARLDTDTLYRSHGRYRWHGDGSIESGERVLRLRRLRLLRVVSGVVVRASHCDRHGRTWE